MRTLVFGDVHGCVDELHEMIHEFGPKSGDMLISAGDLIDKGPKPLEVLRLCHSMGVLTVMGNHDEKLRRYIKYMRRGTPDKAARIKRAEELHKVYSDMSEDLRDYVVGMPVYYRDMSGFCVVHGGIEPVCHQMPYDPRQAKGLAKPQRGALWTTKWVRYVRPDTGKMVPRGSEISGDVFWADLYDGRFGTAYFGHQPFVDTEPPEFKHAVALDTGCVHGGYLTGAVIQDGEMTHKIQVKAKAAYTDINAFY